MISNIKYAILVLLFVAAPVFAESPSSLDPWIPKGWKLILTATGDLNRDNVEDVVLVLEENNPANLKKNDGLGKDILNENPRRLVILLKTLNGYRNVLSRDDLLPSENDESTPCLADPLLEQGGISISNGVLVIEQGMWLSCGSYGVTHEKFTFRFEDMKFRLIGYDYSEFSRSTGEQSEHSINYLTGKKKSTTGLNAFENSKPKVSWTKISSKKNFYIDEISLYCDRTDPAHKNNWCQ